MTTMSKPRFSVPWLALILALCVALAACSPKPADSPDTAEPGESATAAPSDDDAGDDQLDDDKEFDGLEAAPAGSNSTTVAPLENTPKAAEKVGGSGTIETVGEGANAISVIRVAGTRYEMGYWYGKKAADQIAEICKLVDKMIAGYGLPIEAIDNAASALWNPDLYDVDAWTKEIEGMAAGCKAGGHPEVTFEILKRTTAIPDLSEYNCSLFVAWGKATAGEEMYQMRNLDWSMDTGFQDYPVVVVYSPTDGLKHAVVGFAGIAGASVGGMNEKGLAVSEIMGHFCDEETLQGYPFPFLLRDLLYYDTNKEDALDRMRAATRTNQYHYAIGDPNAEDPKGVLLMTSNTRFDEYVDNQSVDPHPCEDVTPYHITFDDVVYWKNHNGKDNQVLYDAIDARYGSIDGPKAIEIAKAACVDGTLVSIIYHNSGNDMWVAFAEGMNPGPKQGFVHVSLD